MISVRTVLRQVPDARGKQGLQHPLDALLGLILLSMLSGRKGMQAAYRLGRALTRKQLTVLGFRRDRKSPCHATLTETLRILDPDAMAQSFSQLTVILQGVEASALSFRQIAIDGKTMRATKNATGDAEHVLSAFCAALGQSVGHTSSRGKGMEIPDAMHLLQKTDLEGKVVTGDAMFCQKKITSLIVEKCGDYVFPVKKNQKHLHKEIETAFTEPVFPLTQWEEPPQPGHGRIDQRHIDLLPAAALSDEMLKAWPTIRCIARVTRNRQHIRAGKVKKTQTETTYLICSLTKVTPEAVLNLNRKHWQIETMHRDKDVMLGEDGYTNRSDHAPKNVFTLTSAALTILKNISASPTKAIEMVQDKGGIGIELIAGIRKKFL